MRHRIIDGSSLPLRRSRRWPADPARVAISAAGPAARTPAGVPSVLSAGAYGPCFSGYEEGLP
jgi:hypothetical protein